VLQIKSMHVEANPSRHTVQGRHQAIQNICTAALHADSASTQYKYIITCPTFILPSAGLRNI